VDLALLRDGVWQFIGVLVALATIAVTLLVYHYQRERRELAFGIFYETRLLSISHELAGRVQITFDGSSVPNVHLVVLALKNSGNRAILATDFQHPIGVSFGEDARLLSVEVSRQVPSNINANVEIEGARFLVHPLLLNPGDFLMVKVLTTGEPSVMRANARVVGIPTLAQIKHVNDYGRKKIRRNLVGLPVLFLIAYFAIPQEPLSWYAAALLILYAAVAIAPWLFAYFRNESNRYVHDDNAVH
jgi:hypothetical protein